MKRKITELEQELINEGFHLTSKFYYGKHNDKTFCYLYVKELDKDIDYVIQLDYKRTKIIKYGIPNVSLDFIDNDKLELIHNLFLDLRDIVEKVSTIVEPIPNELLESVE